MQCIVNRTLGLGCGLVLLLGGLSGCSSKSGDWTFTDAQGDIRALSDFRGQVVVMSFSNTWCDPCHDAAVHMQNFQEKFSNRGVKVLSVSSWEQGDPQDYMNEHGFTYGVMVNGTDLARDYKVDRIPTFVVIGVDGKVLYRHEGLSKNTPKKIEKVVERHLRQHGGKTYASHPG